MSLNLLTDEQCESLWKYRVIDAYEPLKNSEGWLRCEGCGRHPRIWVFNNGRHASCLCFEMYGEHPARAEAVLSVYKRTGKTIEYKEEDLRLAWNKFVETGEMQNKLPDGQW